MSEVIVFVTDFELGTRIADIATVNGKSTVFPDPSDEIKREVFEDVQLVVIDMNSEVFEWKGLVENIRREFPEITIVGFTARVQKRLHDEAKRAGCTWILSKSSVVQNLPKFFEKES